MPFSLDMPANVDANGTVAFAFTYPKKAPAQGDSELAPLVPMNSDQDDPLMQGEDVMHLDQALGSLSASSSGGGASVTPPSLNHPTAARPGR